MDRTFVLIKPDGIQRGLVGEIFSRFEGKGLKLVSARFFQATEAQVTEQYKEHIGKPFFPHLKAYILSGPVLAMVWEGKDAVSVVRRLVGATNPAEAAPGTIRGDLALDTGRNVIHASDSPASAAREAAIYFSEKDLVSYRRIDEPVLYEWVG
ncbi:MAG TPA: nucleoside-diphosphate kinase [Methanomicrobiales archaeon]|nr:nucleoside-diphosphate kinase [Methanomicrobiales archaeon]